MSINIEHVKFPWQTPTPIEKLFTQMKICQAFSILGNDAITDASKIRMTVSLNEPTPFFEQFFCEWRVKSPAKSDYAAFQTHFCQLEKDLNQQAPNVAERGYTYANTATTPIDRYDSCMEPQWSLADVIRNTRQIIHCHNPHSIFNSSGSSGGTKTKPSPASTDIQAIIDAAVTISTRNMTTILSDDACKIPPAGGWSYYWSHGRLRSKKTTAPLARAKKRTKNWRQSCRTTWVANYSSRATPAIVDEMKGQK